MKPATDRRRQQMGDERSGPGKMYLASPYVVAASALEGKIVEWHPGGAV